MTLGFRRLDLHPHVARPRPAVGIRDIYELFVATDGCYTAMASAESFGGPVLKSEDGNEVRNVLYVFEGCFDTT